MLRSRALRKWDGGWEGRELRSHLGKDTADREEERRAFLLLSMKAERACALRQGGMPTRWQSCLHAGGSICRYEPCGEGQEGKGRKTVAGLPSPLLVCPIVSTPFSLASFISRSPNLNSSPPCSSVPVTLTPQVAVAAHAARRMALWGDHCHASFPCFANSPLPSLCFHLFA